MSIQRFLLKFLHIFQKNPDLSLQSTIMTKKNSEGLRILMAEGVSQPHTEATPGEILRCAQDDTGGDNGTQPGTGATSREILRFSEDDKRFSQDDKMEDGVTQPGIDATEA